MTLPMEHSARARPAARHVAIIMDGNGRWALQRGKPRTSGHRAGVRAVRRVVEAARARGLEVLSLFAFSQENWQRPPLEVRLLLELMLQTLQRELKDLHENGIRLRIIGEHDGFDAALREKIRTAEALTANNTGMTLVIAVGYGGQWDIAQAARAAIAAGETVDSDSIERHLSTAGLPPPDLLIRSGGEYRISNFMLWQLAYTELYFTECLWPDADAGLLDQALAWFAGRERRFGRLRESRA